MASKTRNASKDSASGSTEGLSTQPTRLSDRRVRRNRTSRRALTGLLAIFVGMGAFGVFGARTGSVSATSGGYSLTVIYPTVTRPGLPVRWDLTLRHVGGFDGPVHVAMAVAYYRILDFNNLQPQPSATHNQGEEVVMDFDPPDGDTLVVSLDARLQPGRLSGASTGTAVLVKGTPVVSVSYRTRVVP